MNKQRTLVFFGAHPDDESFGIGSTLAQYAASGVKAYYVCSTGATRLIGKSKCQKSSAGISHGSDYLIEDYQLAVLNPAKVMAMLVIDLLANNAAKGREVFSKSKPDMTKQEYLTFMESLLKEEEYEG